MSAIDLFVKGNSLSKKLFASYKPFNMVDGEGVRCSIYLSGCLFNCTGCYNKSIQNFSNGSVLDETLIDQILSDLEKPYCDGLSILGGDPLFNIESTLKIIDSVKSKFGDSKNIWLWTGFTFDEIKNDLSKSSDPFVYNNINMLINNIDVLIDGQFKQSEFKLNLTHRGSYNQEIIDMKLSQLLNKKVLWNDGSYLEYDNKIIQKTTTI